MRRLLGRFLCAGLSLVLLWGGAGLAETGRNADFFLTQLEALERGHTNLDYPRAAVAVGDTLYILTDQELYLWRSGMDAPQALDTFSQGEEAAQAPHSLEEVLSQVRYFSPTLFTDGQHLMALVKTSWTDTGGITLGDGEVWQITDDSGALNASLRATLDFSTFKTLEGEYSNPDIKDMAVADGWLYMAAVDYEKSQSTTLYRWELSTGKEGKEIPCQITSMTPYKDGLFLCLLIDESEWSDGEEPKARLATLDPQTGAFEELFSLGGYQARGLGYNLEKDTLYYLDDTVLYSLPGLALPAQRSAYFINRISDDDMSCGLMEGGAYYQCDRDGVSVRAVDAPGVEDGALSISGSYGNAAHLAFSIQHPEIPTLLSNHYYDSLEAFAGAMVSGQDGVDVLRLYTDSNPIGQMIDKGYAMDLSGNAQVMATAEAMYPALVDGCRRDGKVYALPLEVYAYSLGYFQAIWGELGLTREELPKTWLELLDFIAHWQEEYGEDHPEILLIDEVDGKNALLNSLMETYTAYSLKTWGKIDFDAPLFAKLMQAFDRIDFDQLSLAMEGMDAEELWNSGKYLFSRDVDYLQLEYQERDRQEGSWLATPLPLPLDQGLDIVISAGETVMLINPRTTRAEQAQLYLSTVSQYYDKTSANITLFPEHNEPVPSLSFEEDLAGWKESLASVQKALETAAPEERADLAQQEKDLTEWIANAEDYRYTVTPGAIAWYRENIAPYLYVTGQTPLNIWRKGKENEFVTLMRQYKDGAIPLERFMKEMANRVRMMELESQ